MVLEGVVNGLYPVLIRVSGIQSLYFYSPGYYRGDTWTFGQLNIIINGSRYVSNNDSLIKHCAAGGVGVISQRKIS